MTRHKKVMAVKEEVLTKYTTEDVKTFRATPEMKHELAIQLHRWLGNSKFKSMREFALVSGIHEDALEEYFGGKAFPQGENLQKLANFTNLPLLNSFLITNIVKEKLNAQERTKKIINVLHQLNEELEFFKKSTPEERKIFRNTVPGRDIGYIISLLKALYDEDLFQDWILVTEYKLGMKGGQK